MKTIKKNDNFKIVEDEDTKMYTIFFSSTNEEIIRSITKTKIILGASTTEKFNTLKFKAVSVKSFKEHQEKLELETGTKRLSYESALKMTYNLATQLNYLITNYSKTFLGYSIENLIVIDNNKFVYLSNEYMFDIDDEKIIITLPFSQKDIMITPELLKIKKLPSIVNYKVSYYNFGYLILYGLTGEDNLMNSDEESKSKEMLRSQMERKEIKNTKLYWLIERCLVEEPNNRSIIFI